MIKAARARQKQHNVWAQPAASSSIECHPFLSTDRTGRSHGGKHSCVKRRLKATAACVRSSCACRHLSSFANNDEQKVYSSSEQQLIQWPGSNRRHRPLDPSTSWELQAGPAFRYRWLNATRGITSWRIIIQKFMNKTGDVTGRIRRARSPMLRKARSPAGAAVAVSCRSLFRITEDLSIRRVWCQQIIVLRRCHIPEEASSIAENFIENALTRRKKLSGCSPEKATWFLRRFHQQNSVKPHEVSALCSKLALDINTKNKVKVRVPSGCGDEIWRSTRVPGR